MAETTVAADANIREIVTEVARSLAEEVAPDEVPFFDLAAEAYWDDPEQQGPSGGTARKLGSGLGDLGPLLIPVLP